MSVVIGIDPHKGSHAATAVNGADLAVAETLDPTHDYQPQNSNRAGVSYVSRHHSGGPCRT